MKSNGLLKWLMIPVLLLAVFIGLRACSGKKASTATAEAATQLSASEMKSLGIEGDTPRDTVATLVAQVKQLRGELQTTMSDNKAQKAEADRLRQRESDIDQRIKNAVQVESDKLRQENTQIESSKTNSLIEDMQRRIDTMSQKPRKNSSAKNDPLLDGAELPVGLGFDDPSRDTLVWHEPQDARKEDRSRPSSLHFPASFQTGMEDKSLFAGEKIRHESFSDKAGESTLTPIYTVPANATLTGSIAMTALIGRVPVDGTVNDPFPFKVLIGADNLTANGIELPEVSGAVLSGTASGDWTLSCVRGQIQSITFVFNDGTVRTIPPASAGEGRSSGHNSGHNTRNSNGLGWISDPHGIPCVGGERRSNAQQYLTTQSLITAAGAGAASLIKSDNGNFSYMNSNGSMGQVGISGNDAMGQILMGGVKDMSQWVNKLYGQAFAAVYVPPGAKIAVHIDQELAIDFDEAGRRVNHLLEKKHVQELD